MRLVFQLMLAALLAACGGGGGDDDQRADAPADPPRDQVLEPERPPVDTPEKPVNPKPNPEPDPEPELKWATAWTEEWQTTVFGGWVRHSLLRCEFGDPDPNLPRTQEFNPFGATWSHFGSSGASAWIEGGKLQINGYTAGAVLGWPTFDHTKPIRVSAVVDVEQSRGSWVGITLIQDETDYREIALEWYADGLWVELYAPCFSQRLARVDHGPRELTLEYLPSEGWRYLVDDQLIYFEPMSNLGAGLVGDPRVGIYWHVHKGGPVPVRASVGFVQVWQAKGP